MLPTRNMYQHCLICHTTKEEKGERWTNKMLLLPPIMTREHRGTARNDVSPWLRSAVCLGTLPMTTGYLHVGAAGALVTSEPWWLFPVCLWVVVIPPENTTRSPSLGVKLKGLRSKCLCEQRKFISGCSGGT